MNSKKLANFRNDGFGWVCINCERLSESANAAPPSGLSRIMREGEAESKQPRFSNSALAKWMNETRTALVCPQCQIVENIEEK